MLLHPPRFPCKLCIFRSVCNKHTAKLGLQLVSNRHPIVPQIVSPSKHLQIVSVRHQTLNHLVDVKRLLTLPQSLRINHIGFKPKVRQRRRISLRRNPLQPSPFSPPSTFPSSAEGKSRDSSPGVDSDCTSPTRFRRRTCSPTPPADPTPLDTWR